MEKSKVWIKDRLSISDYQVGQKVRVFRRKKNGYPNAMIDGESYLIREIKYDSLVLISLDGDDWFCTKVHCHKKQERQIIDFGRGMIWVSTNKYNKKEIREIKLRTLDI